MKPLFFIFMATSAIGFANTSMPTKEFSPIIPNNEPKIVLNNKPLMRVNGKVISLIDVVKKMDLLIHEYALDAGNSKTALYQFYMANWKDTLDELVADQLILADAKEKEVEVSEGEIREEIEDRFGPNVMANLHQLNLQYDEAKEMIEAEITVRRMVGFKVYSKAQQGVTPKNIKEAYSSYLESNPPMDKWKYQVLSIRGKNQADCEKIADMASQLITDCKDLGILTEKLKSDNPYENVTINLSNEYEKNENDVSNAHRSALATLKIDDYSQPVKQISRHDNSTVYRLFHLKSHETQEATSFPDLYDQLSSYLLHQAADKEKKVYISRLKERFGTSNFITDEYRPFELQ